MAVEFFEKIDWSTLQRAMDFELFVVGKEAITAGAVVAAIAFWIVVYIGAGQLHNWLLNRVSRRYSSQARMYNFSKILRLLLATISLFVGLEILGISVSSVYTIIAALGVGIGFGMQHLVNNLMSGLILLFESPIEVGDIIEVDGKMGRVTEIGMRATRVVNMDNIEILVPNSHLLENNLINWTLSDNVSRVPVEFGVHYESDRVLLEEIVLAIASDHPDVVDIPEPSFLLTEFADSSVNYRLNVWTAIPWDRFRIASEIRLALFDAFDEKGIRIPYPQRDVHFINPPS